MWQIGIEKMWTKETLSIGVCVRENKAAKRSADHL